MTLDHVALTVGIVAFVLIVLTTSGFRAVKQKLTAAKRAKFEAVLHSLDTLKFLPALWVVTVLGVGGWLLARVLISYS